MNELIAMAVGFVIPLFAWFPSALHVHKALPKPKIVWNHGLASWYYDGGSTGCGFHSTYGIATSIVACGSRVQLNYNGHIINAIRDDSPGPAVAAGGRTFDLNQTTKAALGCPDLCYLKWRYVK